ncbi:hypothetical protein CK489_32465 [Bradyrhizobium sp. UFLA03-84]|nr:hypothetical protein CK489_32465 [Bradyrhizobium sp. UFLA03-84]
MVDLATQRTHLAETIVVRSPLVLAGGILRCAQAAGCSSPIRGCWRRQKDQVVHRDCRDGHFIKLIHGSARQGVSKGGRFIQIGGWPDVLLKPSKKAP